MLNVIVLGLTALSYITGFTSGTSYTKQYDDFVNMANAIGQNVTEANGELSISNTLYCDDLYTLSGENRYYELSWSNGYLIYDKKDDKIDEISFNKPSPYVDYRSNFKIYNENIFDFKYAFHNLDTDSFVNIVNGGTIDNKVSSYYKSNKSKDAGTYYRYIKPSVDAHFAKNSFYFENLYEMHGNNQKGTCAVVSTEILLGYYDTFVSDNIVEEKYDCITSQYVTDNKISSFTQSPGVDNMKEGISAFHDAIVQIGKSLVIDDPEDNGMTTFNQILMIKKYLELNKLSYSLNTSEGNPLDIWDGHAMSVIRNAIDAGRPVIANGNGHSSVAYAYDDEYVYVHTGWGYTAATPWTTYSSGFFNNYSAGSIDLIFEGKVSHCHSNNYFSTATNKYICPCGALHEETTLRPYDYGFEPQYFFYSKSHTINCGDLTIETDRLRTGYIEGTYINLSPRRSGAGVAYLEYSFNKSVERISFNISFWSGAESLSTSDSYAYFQVRDPFGNWVTYIDLLKDVSLSQNRYSQNHFEFNFSSQDVYCVRFISHSSAVGDRNKGRISIGMMKILHNA